MMVFIMYLFLSSIVTFDSCYASQKPQLNSQIDFGNRLGDVLRKYNEDVRGDVNRDASQVSEVYKNVASRMLTTGDAFVNPAVSEVVARANELAITQDAPLDPLCVRRWNARCPDGWTLLEGGGCAAPSSYAGGCAVVQSFKGADTHSKATFARICGAPWPCEDECADGHSYSTLCPIDWDHLGDGFCEKRVSSNMSCPSAFQFSSKSVTQLQDLSKACGITWPCMTSCEKDYQHVCPSGWVQRSGHEEHGLCIAPLTYMGNCGFAFNTVGASVEQKRALAIKCAVAWPCIGNASAHPDTEHDRSADGAVSMQDDLSELSDASHALAEKQVDGINIDWLGSGPIGSD